jgi:hypothetical protein
MCGVCSRASIRVTMSPVVVWWWREDLENQHTAVTEKDGPVKLLVKAHRKRKELVELGPSTTNGSTNPPPIGTYLPRTP